MKKLISLALCLALILGLAACGGSDFENAMTKAQKDKLREFDAALSDKNYQKRKSFTERLRDCFSDK